MAYEVRTEDGEEVLVNIVYRASEKSEPFHFAVTNRALFIPRKKLIAKTDPFYFERVAFLSVREVAVQSLKPYGLWFLAGAMCLFGLATAIAMLWPFFNGVGGKVTVSGWPFGILVGGILMPFAARRRYGLLVTFNSGSFKWNPPLVIGKAAKDKINAVLQTILDGCNKAGILTSDRRNHRHGNTKS